MPGLIVAVAGDTTDVKGVPGELVAPPGVFVSVTPTVLAMGKPVLTLGATVPTHGNPTNSTAPGYNPPCACAKVELKTIPTILVEGKPLAVIGVGTGSVASCGHYVLGPGAPTVMVNTGG
jgi:hypothetical protein